LRRAVECSVRLLACRREVRLAMREAGSRCCALGVCRGLLSLWGCRIFGSLAGKCTSARERKMNGEPMKRVDLRMFPMILASLILITRFRGSKNSFISSRVKPSMLGISTSISSSLTVMGCPIFDAENLSKKYRTHHVRRRLSRSTGLRVVCRAADLCMPRLRAILVAMPL
jgi:hypothetical protein